MTVGRADLNLMKILDKLTEGWRPMTRPTGEMLSSDCHDVIAEVSDENSLGLAFVSYLLKSIDNDHH